MSNCEAVNTGRFARLSNRNRSVDSGACPCCGKPLDRLAIALSDLTLGVGWSSESVHLTPREAELADILIKASPVSLALEAIIERMQGLTEHDYPRHNVWVLIRRLRGKIAPIGLAIESSQGRFRGGDCAYRLVRRGSPPQ